MNREGRLNAKSVIFERGLPIAINCVDDICTDTLRCVSMYCASGFCFRTYTSHVLLRAFVWAMRIRCLFPLLVVVYMRLEQMAFSSISISPSSAGHVSSVSIGVLRMCPPFAH